MLASGYLMYPTADIFCGPERNTRRQNCWNRFVHDGQRTSCQLRRQFNFPHHHLLQRSNGTYFPEYL